MRKRVTATRSSCPVRKRLQEVVAHIQLTPQRVPPTRCHSESRQLVKANGLQILSTTRLETKPWAFARGSSFASNSSERTRVRSSSLALLRFRRVFNLGRLLRLPLLLEHRVQPHSGLGVLHGAVLAFLDLHAQDLRAEHAQRGRMAGRHRFERFVPGSCRERKLLTSWYVAWKRGLKNVNINTFAMANCGWYRVHYRNINSFG